MKEKRARKRRKDRRHRLTLRIPRGVYNKCRVIAFNSNISINRTIEMLLVAALESPAIVDAIYAAFPPQREQFIYVEDDFAEKDIEDKKPKGGGAIKWDF